MAKKKMKKMKMTTKMKIDYDFIGGLMCCIIIMVLAWAFLCVAYA